MCFLGNHVQFLLKGWLSTGEMEISRSIILTRSREDELSQDSEACC